jgi:hypothetical protein
MGSCRTFFCFLLIFHFLLASGASDSLNTPRKVNRKLILGASTGLVGVGSLIYLNQAWYADYKTEGFHFFDDNGEWLQMDKLGHTFSTYQTGRLMMEAFDWAGYNKKQKLFIGGAMGLYYLTLIECMDGFSEGWGFSWGDMAANALGSALAISQEAMWGEQRIQLKFFYSNSGLAQYNADLLGESAYTRPLKDYNGQSYWLSVSPSAFFKRKTFFPKWLALSFGYGAYGMIGANENPALVDKDGNPVTYERYRRYYFSFDLDLKQIKTRSKFLGALFSVVNVLKFPCPTLEYSQGSFKVHTFYP